MRALAEQRVSEPDCQRIDWCPIGAFAVSVLAACDADSTVDGIFNYLNATAAAVAAKRNTFCAELALALPAQKVMSVSFSLAVGHMGTHFFLSTLLLLLLLLLLLHQTPGT